MSQTNHFHKNLWASARKQLALSSAAIEALAAQVDLLETSLAASAAQIADLQSQLDSLQMGMKEAASLSEGEAS